jgi:hypothetical protein
MTVNSPNHVPYCPHVRRGRFDAPHRQIRRSNPNRNRKMILNDKHDCIESLESSKRRRHGDDQQQLNFPTTRETLMLPKSWISLLSMPLICPTMNGPTYKRKFGWASQTWRDGLVRAAHWLGSLTETTRLILLLSSCQAITCFASRSVSRIEITMSFYDRDPTVLFSGQTSTSIHFSLLMHIVPIGRVSECSMLEQAVMMRGAFELGILSDHTYHWTFTPTRAGELAIVLPVYDGGRLVDFLAIARHDHTVWGCYTGAGQYGGSTTAHRRNQRSPITALFAKLDNR